MHRGAAGTCRPSRVVKPSNGFLFCFQRLSTSGFIRKKETYLPVRKFDWSIKSYAQYIIGTIFYHVVSSLNWNVRLQAKILLERTYFFGSKNGKFQIRYNKWLSTELNHTLKNWRKIKHIWGNKNSDLPNNHILYGLFWKIAFDEVLACAEENSRCQGRTRRVARVNKLGILSQNISPLYFSYFVKIIWCSCWLCTPPPLFWGWILLILRSPKGSCCSISDDLSCFFYTGDVLQWHT